MLLDHIRIILSLWSNINFFRLFWTTLIYMYIFWSGHIHNCHALLITFLFSLKRPMRLLKGSSNIKRLEPIGITGLVKITVSVGLSKRGSSLLPIHCPNNYGEFAQARLLPRKFCRTVVKK